MKNIVIDSLRDLDILIKKRLFALGKKYGIKNPPSPLQVRIFMYIQEHNGENITPAYLARELQVSKVAIGEALNKMQHNGTIKINDSSEDGRKKILSCTEEGILKMKKMKESLKPLNDEILVGISDEDLKIFISVINRMKENIKENKNV